MALELKKIRWNNAFIFSGTYELELPQHGLILLEGRNIDAGGSNGAGKTSFLNLIPTALFEKNPSGLVKDKLIHRKNKSAFIELTLGDDIKVFYERGKGNKSSTWEVRKNGQLLKKENLRETKDIIEDIIGIDYGQYTSAIHLCQNITLGFFLLSGSERLDLLTKMLQLDRYDIASQNAKREFDRYVIEKEKLVSKIEEINLQIKQLDVEIGRFKNMPSIDLNKLESERIKTEQEYNELIREHEDLNFQFVNIKLTLDNLVQEKAKIEKDRRLIEHNLNEMGQISLEFKRIQNQIKELDIKIKQEQEQRNLLQKMKKIENELQNEINKINTEGSVISHEIAEMEKILDLSVGDLCPVCGRTIELGKFEIRKQEIQKHIAEKQLYLSQLRTVYQNKIKQHDINKRDIQALEYELGQIEGYKTQKAVFEERLRRDIATEEKQLREKDKEYEKNLEEIEQEFLVKTDQMQILDQQIKQVKVKMGQYSQKLLSLSKQKVEEEKRLELISTFTERQDDLNKRRQEIESTIANIDEQMVYYKWWIDGFKKFKILEINHAIEIIQTLLDKYIERLFENRLEIKLDVFKFKKTKKSEFDFKNELNISINDGEVPLEGFSGGERQLMGLAMLLALNDFFSANFILLDEVFGSLDFINRERVLRLLESLRNEKLIMVVTHLEEIKSAIDWDLFYVIERKNGQASFRIER